MQFKQDTYALLRQLIKELPDEQRQVLTMRHYMDMSFKEIAAATGVSINTSLARMRYALINLRKKLKNTTSSTILLYILNRAATLEQDVYC